LYTKWKLKLSGQEGIRYICLYKMEAEALWARGDTAHLFIQNGS
jgi:hypothetical protein